MSSKKRKYRETFASTIGGALVDFDYQIFRTTPPPEELVHAGEETRGLSGEPDVRIEVLEDEVADAPAAEPRRA